MYLHGAPPRFSFRFPAGFEKEKMEMGLTGLLGLTQKVFA